MCPYTVPYHRETTVAIARWGRVANRTCSFWDKICSHHSLMWDQAQVSSPQLQAMEFLCTYYALSQRKAESQKQQK